jgi:NADPH:quinone reductase-like Zn-dependent oxidoreductase
VDAMRAVQLTGAGGAADLEIRRLPVPHPGPGEVVVRVHAAAITRDELTWPTDRLPAIPSYELSGVVSAVGADVADVAAGDEVWALTPFERDGVAADYAIVPAAVLAPKPPSLSHVEAAALPLPGLSAWQGLLEHGALHARERVRITGPRGGVGHLAVQIARSRGAEIAGDDGEVDLLFDTVGGEVLRRTAEHAERVVSVAEEPPSGGAYFVVEPNRAQLAELGRLVAAGELAPEIDSVFPLSDARAAFERCAARGKHGKVVLQVAED